MFGHSPIESNRDRKVKVYLDNNSVSASTAQSEYARFLNFIGDRFTAVSNTVSGVKTYDIALKYADKIIPYEEGVAKGSTPGYLNFEGDHFDVSSLASNMYTVTSTGWVKVNSFTVKPLNIVNATNNEAVTAAEGASTIDLTFNNDETNIYSNGTLVGTAPRAPNFSTDFTLTDDSANDRVNIALATTNQNFIPTPNSKKWGSVQGGQIDLNGSFGDGLFNLPYTSTSGATVAGNNDNTHGHARRYTLDGADNDTLEVATDFNLTQLSYNPHIYGKMAMTTLDDSRFFLGFNSTDVPTGSNTYLNNQSGFALTYQYDTAETEDTTWIINRNDGDASEDKVSTGINLSSTTPFTFELVGDTANSRWGWNVNGGTFTYYTTEIPTTNTNQRFTFRIEQIGDSSVIVTDLYYLYLVQDK
jgi:hypothetical protein